MSNGEGLLLIQSSAYKSDVKALRLIFLFTSLALGYERPPNITTVFNV